MTRKELTKYMKKKFNRIFKWIKSNFQTFFNIILLLTSIYALVLAKQQINQSNEQFEKNSKSSDSIFKAQNEELKKIQSITSNQIEITKNQLKETIYQTRPKISLINFDGYYFIDAERNPIIFKNDNNLEIENVGGRSARNIEVIFISLLNDFSINSKKEKFYIVENLNPEEKIRKDFSVELTKTVKNNYYVYFKIIYHDLTLKKKFEQEYYYKLSEEPIDIVEVCTSLEIEKIRTKVGKI